jgi:hypothetical protein
VDRLVIGVVLLEEYSFGTSKVSFSGGVGDRTSVVLGFKCLSQVYISLSWFSWFPAICGL